MHRNQQTVDLALLEDKLKALLTSVQSASNPKELVFEHDPIGLGGQISRRILALRIAAVTGARAVFPNESMYPYELPFEIFNSACSGSTPKMRLESLACAKEDTNWPRWFDYWHFIKNDQDVKAIYDNVPFMMGAADRNINLFYDGLLLNMQCLKPKYAEMVNSNRKRLRLLTPYVAVHLRRGDKRVETPFVPSSMFRDAVHQECEKLRSKLVFIASDSPTAEVDLSLDSNHFQTVFDESEKRLNNANHKYLMKNPSCSKEETEVAIKNIYLLAGADRIVGQDNAHFATLAASAISYRKKSLDFGTLVNGRVLLAKARWKLAYKVLLAVRKLGKALLRKRTIPNRLKYRKSNSDAP